jgi:hypothetical protein
MNSGIAGFNASDGSAVMGLCAEVGSSEAAAAPPGAGSQRTIQASERNSTGRTECHCR